MWMNFVIIYMAQDHLHWMLHDATKYCHSFYFIETTPLLYSPLARLHPPKSEEWPLLEHQLEDCVCVCVYTCTRGMGSKSLVELVMLYTL